MSEFFESFTETLKGGVPNFLTGDSPAQQRIGQGFRKRGPFGGLINALSEIPDLAGDVVSEFSPHHALKALESPELTGAQKAIIGGGALLGIAGIAGGPRAYHAAKARSGFDESGVLNLQHLFGRPSEWPTYPELRQPRRGVPLAYHRFDPRAVAFTNASSFDHLANLVPFRSDVSPLERQAVAGWFQGLARRVNQEVPGHVEANGMYLSPEMAELRTAGFILSRLDSLYRQNKLGPDLAKTYRTFLDRPLDTPLEDLQHLDDFVVNLSRNLDDVDSPTLDLPSHKELVLAEQGPDGPRLYVSWTNNALRRRMTDDEIAYRLKHMDFEPLQPRMTQAILQMRNVWMTEEEIAEGIDWYYRANQLSKDLVDIAKRNGDDLTQLRAAGILSLLSGAQEWGENVRIATEFVRSRGRWNFAGAAVSKDAISKVRRLWDGEDPKIDSDKQANFFANILDPDNPDPGTMDRHAFDIAMGFTTGIEGRPLFDDPKSYRVFLRAYQRAAAVEALKTQEIQAVTWAGIKSLKNPRTEGGLVGKGVPFKFTRKVLEEVAGAVPNDNLATLARRAHGDDVGDLSTGLPHTPLVAGKPQRFRNEHVVLEAILPDGQSAVFGSGTERLGVQLRSLYPVFTEVDKGGIWRWIPGSARVVADANQVVRSATNSLDDGRTLPVAQIFTSPHEVDSPGNRIRLQASDPQRIEEFLRAADEIGLQLPIRKEHPVTRIEKVPELDPKAPRIEFRQVSASQFATAVKKAASRTKRDRLGRKRQVGETVYVYPLDDYRKMKTFLSPDGKTGFAVKSDGDLVSVFNVGQKRAGEAAVVAGLQNGATKLDAFDEDGYLPTLYAKYGFKEYKRDSWNPEYAPPNWSGDTPDVVYMRHEPVERPHHSVVVELPDHVDENLVDEVWELARTYGRPTAYLHGEINPAGTVRVVDYAHQDRAGVRGLVRYQASPEDLFEPNAFYAYVDEGEAKALPKRARPDAPKIQKTSGIYGDLLVNDRVRVFVDQASKFKLKETNLLDSTLNGKRVSHVAIWSPPQGLPAVVIGDSVETATKRLTEMFGLSEADIVKGKVIRPGGGRPHVRLASPERQQVDVDERGRTLSNRVLGAHAAQVLADLGVPSDRIEVDRQVLATQRQAS